MDQVKKIKFQEKITEQELNQLNDESITVKKTKRNSSKNLSTFLLCLFKDCRNL